MPTPSPRKCAFVLAHADVRFAAVEDQEQVDKILSVPDRLPKLEQWSTTRRAACATTIMRGCTRSTSVIEDGRKALAERPGAARDGSTRRSRQGKGRDPPSSSTRRARPGAPKGVVLSHERLDRGRADTVRFDKLTEKDEVARLSAARLGRRSLPQLRARPGRGLLRRLPGKRRDRDGGSARDRPDLFISRRRACSRACSRA